jgi:drug/metabolite transporter (DMT)-like permease
MIAALDWIGCIFGVAGAFLLATRTRYSGWGFVLFLVSNLAWGWYGVLTKTESMIIMQVAFTATSLLGIWRWVGSDTGRVAQEPLEQRSPIRSES